MDWISRTHPLQALPDILKEASPPRKLVGRARQGHPCNHPPVQMRKLRLRESKCLAPDHPGRIPAASVWKLAEGFRDVSPRLHPPSWSTLVAGPSSPADARRRPERPFLWKSPLAVSPSPSAPLLVRDNFDGEPVFCNRAGLPEHTLPGQEGAWGAAQLVPPRAGAAPGCPLPLSGPRFPCRPALAPRWTPGLGTGVGGGTLQAGRKRVLSAACRLWGRCPRNTWWDLEMIRY